VSVTDSDDGSVTVAMHFPEALVSQASIAVVPPAVPPPLVHVTDIVRKVAPDHDAETVMFPLPEKSNWFDRLLGGSRYPCVCVRFDETWVVGVGAAVVVVVVVGAGGATAGVVGGDDDVPVNTEPDDE
jgi:hypothetical protein